MLRWWTRLFSFSRPQPTTDVGSLGEELATRFLKSSGYKILDRNHLSSTGELDIIARSRDGCLVFVEVKTRTSSDPESGFAAVHLSKQKQLTRTALAYLKRERRLQERCRFDVIVVTIQEGLAPQIHHVPNAFDATGVNSMFS